MRPALGALAWFVCTILAAGLAGCTEVAPLPPAEPEPHAHTVRVVSNGWHTAIVVERADVAATGLLPEVADFPVAAVLEFGWGDRVYYPAREKTIGMTLAAAFTETPAVMHLAGLDRPPERRKGDVDVEPVGLSQAGLRALIGAIAESFERADNGRAAPVSRGLYANSRFYRARGTFHLFNTCNTWTGRMLRAGGVDLSPSGVITADELMARLRAALG